MFLFIHIDETEKSIVYLPGNKCKPCYRHNILKMSFRLFLDVVSPAGGAGGVGRDWSLVASVQALEDGVVGSNAPLISFPLVAVSVVVAAAEAVSVPVNPGCHTSRWFCWRASPRGTR